MKMEPSTGPTSTTIDDTFVVIANPASNAIGYTLNDAEGFISEHERNVIRWYIGNAVSPSSAFPDGWHNVPMVSTTGGAPQTVAAGLRITSAGDAGGYLDFATWNTAPGNQIVMSLLPAPSGVTHMGDILAPGVGNSENAMNRFWVIDPTSYTTKPGGAMTMAYDPDELEGTMAPGNLQLQRFNEPAEDWGDFLPATIQAPNRIGVADIPSAQFFKSWTLASASDPLPIELTSFEATCAANGRVLIEWVTASETNNKEFVVERSEEGVFWETILTMDGAGNSSTERKYSAYDESPGEGLMYYRISQTDFDGTKEVFTPVVSDCDGVGFEFLAAFAEADDNNIQLLISSGDDKVIDIEVYNMNGRLVTSSRSENVQSGMTYLSLDRGSMTPGMYIVRVQNQDKFLTRKVVLN